MSSHEGKNSLAKMALAMDLTKVKFILLYMSTKMEGLGEDKLVARWGANLESVK